MTNYLVGIDDTDNLESRGTGFLARSMAKFINDNGLGIPGGITRHQLLFDPRVPYTSQNSSACFQVTTSNPKQLWETMIEFLIKSCAVGSDCGLCMVEEDDVPLAIVEWGYRAKTELVNKKLAADLAQAHNISLIGLTGTHDGIIGALAAVGLRSSGNDGRFVSLKGVDIRTIEGTHSLLDLQNIVPVHEAIGIDGKRIESNITICFDNGWFRPVLKNGKTTIVITNTNIHEHNHYKLADKDYIKSISN
ncbi:MAG: hypothetical protein RBT19_11625 [Tenuifilaceae bacterium]|jgi:hypothetical protein|nr:hypothetical protein [Tenuifilaceae bacterium]